MYDFKNTVENRFPNVSLKFRDVRVQGQESPESIVQGIKDLNSEEDIDVIVLTRGGGSEEDLESFDDERVVRAISESKKPIISAIGHEDDYSLADYAADKRAMTPTDAGVVSVLDQEEILREIENYETSLESSYKEFKQRISQSQKIKLYKRILIGLAIALGIGLLIFLYKIL